jgi:hypothetical protein
VRMPAARHVLPSASTSRTRISPASSIMPLLRWCERGRSDFLRSWATTIRR